MTDASRTAKGAPESAVRAMAYLRDAESEAIVRQCLADLGVDDVFYGKGGIDGAISDLAKRQSPRLLIVDVSGSDDPVTRVADLAQLCEPSTGVVVIGDANDVVLYRQLKSEGIVEYYFKPLVLSLVTQTCSFILGGASSQRGSRTGKLVIVMGVRGGAGATGIVTAGAWHLAEARHRHVLLLDLDLSEGDMALQLDLIPNHTLFEALQQPERVDDMFLERGVIHVTPRLDLLASLEPLDQITALRDEAVLPLLANLLERYRYVLIDLPPSLAPQLPRLLQLPGICVLVSDSSLVAARDVVRWRERLGPNTADRQTFHIVNRAGASGTLPIEDFVRAAGNAPDLIIPYDKNIGVEAMRGAKGLANGGTLERALAPVLQHITGEATAERPSFLSRLFG